MVWFVFKAENVNFFFYLTNNMPETSVLPKVGHHWISPSWHCSDRKNKQTNKCRPPVILISMLYKVHFSLKG